MGGKGSGIKKGKIVKCANCGKEVYKKKKILDKFPRYFCSRACYHFGTRNRIYKKCSHCRKDFITFPSVEAKRGAAQFCSRVCFRKSVKETYIEKIVGEYLESKGHKIERQKKYHNFIMDFYIPEKEMFVEADGKYWHSIPKRIEMDLRKDLLAIKEGYQIVRVGELEVKNGNFVNKLNYI